MAEPAELHASIRTELTTALRELDPELVGDHLVPACPDWRVRDVVAHLVGVAADVLSGNLEGVASDPWTAAQVDARRGASLSEILEEWEELDPQVEAISSAFGPAEHQWLMDCMTHDFDLRGALGLPIHRESEGFGFALGFIAPGYHAVNLMEGRSTPDLQAGDDTWPRAGGTDSSATSEDGGGSGSGEGGAGTGLGADAGSGVVVGGGVVVVAAPDHFELLRGLTGRRSVDQIATWEWSGSSGDYLATFSWGPFVARAEPLVE